MASGPFPLSRLRERARVRASLVRPNQRASSASGTFSRKREKGTTCFQATARVDEPVRIRAPSSSRVMIPHATSDGEGLLNVMEKIHFLSRNWENKCAWVYRSRELPLH